MDTKLSEMQEKINEAQSPLPLFTCLHVKPDVSELMFAGECVCVCFCVSAYKGYCLNANCDANVQHFWTSIGMDV